MKIKENGSLFMSRRVIEFIFSILIGITSIEVLMFVLKVLK